MDAEQRGLAENPFGPSGEEIKDAIKLEDERPAALVKNLYRLRAFRLCCLARTSARPQRRGFVGPTGSIPNGGPTPRLRAVQCVPPTEARAEEVDFGQLKAA